MECKSVGGGLTKGLTLELIDTLWNVNTLEDVIEQTGTTELIDTLWNVNQMFALIVEELEEELIDTLWNVNLIIQRLKKTKKRN